jgi:hypothetical protein
MTTDTTLLQATGIEHLEPEEQEEMLHELGELVQKGTMVRLVELMDEDTQADFEKLLDDDASESEIEAFLSERVSGSAHVAQEVVEEIRDDILALTGESQD